MTHPIGVGVVLRAMAAELDERRAIACEGAASEGAPWRIRELCDPPPSEGEKQSNSQGRIAAGQGERGRQPPEGREPLHWNAFYPVPSNATRRTLHRLRDELRPHWPHVQNRRGIKQLHPTAKCGSTSISKTGQIDVCKVVQGERRFAVFRGLSTCGSVWSCPVCRSKVQSARADEVTATVEWWGVDRVHMLTLTVRHAWTHDPAELRAGLERSWRALVQGEPWKRFASRVQLGGHIRGLEVTHGPHGWHPHLHVLLLVADTDALRAETAWIQHRWQEIVAEQIGGQHAPTLENGAHVSEARKADYISKLGLEVTNPSDRAEGAHRTPLEIAAGYVLHRRPADLALYMAYAEAFKGARALTWSKGLKKRAGLDDKDDAQLAAELPVVEDVVAEIPVSTWKRIRGIRGAKEAILCLAEEHAAADVKGFLAHLAGEA